MDLQQINLRNGVSKIISQHSPAAGADDVRNFLFSTHAEREILYILGGNSRYMLNRSVYDALPGTVFLIDHWIPHAFGYRKEDHDLLHLWFHLHRRKLTCTLLQIGQSGTFQSCGLITMPMEIMDLLIRRWKLLENEPHVTETIIEEYMLTPLNLLLDEFQLQKHHRQQVDSNSIKTVIESVKHHIRMCKGRDCSLDKLEQISGFNRYYLAHSFRKHAECTIGAYIDRIRVEYSAEAILRGLTQKEIAFELGFVSPANYWTWLRKHRDQVTQEQEQIRKQKKY
ncbi:MAG: helix-turn-helix domain-containing protein [Lentisphaeria bacterium]|nr:helix-turn-helix domain-containing protein [Lentisphaeria bacterium]